MDIVFYFTKHALEEINNDDLDIEEIKRISVFGEVIRTYPEDKKGESKLILGWSELNYKYPIHVVCSLQNSTMHIITAYKPNPDIWNSDFKTKKS